MRERENEREILENVLAAVPFMSEWRLPPPLQENAD